ncbi:MAG: restriction endonuclease subunit S [Roseomonas sp.]|nr:restriction endonuclease subunit S [Roseomonas sp.]
MGQAPVGSSYNHDGEGYPLLAGAGDFGVDSPIATKYTTQPTKISQPGDVLLCIRATVGDLNWSDKAYCLGRGVAGLRPRNGKLDRRYLWRCMEHVRPELEKLGRGSTFLQVSRRDIAELAIPLPSDLREQRRIAAILDKADAIRRKREQALTLADEFLRSVFLEMFGEPNTNGTGLRKVPLGDIIKVSSGNGLVGKDMAADGIYPVYGGNGVNGYHSEYMFEEPQIVIGRVGAYCGAVHVSAPKSWVTDNALYIRTYKQPINKIYLEWALRFANLNQYAGRAAQPLISGGRIYEVEILMPDDADQLAFHQIVQTHSMLVSKLKSDAVNLSDLFAALSQRAFAGDL